MLRYFYLFLDGTSHDFIKTLTKYLDIKRNKNLNLRDFSFLITFQSIFFVPPMILNRGLEPTCEMNYYKVSQ